MSTNPILNLLGLTSDGRTNLELQGGPNKLELANALLNSTGTKPLHIGFKVRTYNLDPSTKEQFPHTDTFVNVTVLTVTREDGSGNSFLIQGYAMTGDQNSPSPSVEIFYAMKRGDNCGFIRLKRT